MATNIFAYYNVTVREAEDVSGDEPRLIMAFVTISTNGSEGVQVDVINTGRLGSGMDDEDFIRGRVTSTNAPTVDAPFFGLVTIAIDDDKSFESHRSNHIESFRRSVQQIFTTLHEQPGGIPRMDNSDFGIRQSENSRIVLNTIREASRTEMQRNWLIRDRDDMIGGPTVTIISELGNEFHSSGFASDGHTFNFRKRFLTIFGGDGLYNVDFTLTANDL